MYPFFKSDLTSVASRSMGSPHPAPVAVMIWITSPALKGNPLTTECRSTSPFARRIMMWFAEPDCPPANDHGGSTLRVYAAINQELSERGCLGVASKWLC